MFENKLNNLFEKAGLNVSGEKGVIVIVLISIFVFWLPVAIISLVQGTFWTGEFTGSFITDFDIQARFLISMPILIIADRIVNPKLALILGQFTNSGIIRKGLIDKFEGIIKSRIQFVMSNWTNFTILVICYLQFYLVIRYESLNTSQLTWQTDYINGETTINLAGKWILFLSGPFFLYLIYSWLLRIIIWGEILFRISRLNIRLFPIHPDLAGSLGFLGYSIGYFTPVAFAFSATVAGNMADFMLAENIQLTDLTFPFIGYIIFMTALFTIPMFFFSSKLIDAKEKNVYEFNDFTNGLYRELGKKMSKGFDAVGPKNLELMDYSSASDLSAVVANALKMKLLPITLKDLVPLWIITLIPFLGVVLIEIPIGEILTRLASFLI